MRRFLGEHLTAANDEPSPEDTLRSNENPNLPDLPEQALDHQPGTASGANPFWSSRMQEEYQLQQMRPEHLPPLESGDPWASLDTRGGSSEELTTSDLLMLTAQEMDRQTSVGRFTQADALQRICGYGTYGTGIFQHGCWRRDELWWIQSGGGYGNIPCWKCWH